jgi:transposase
MVKAIAYAKVKTDKVDARTLADLLRADMIPESYVPDEKTREVRDLVRRRHGLVETRTGFKNKVKAELAKRWVKHEGDVFTQQGRKFLRSLHIHAVDDYMDTIEFLDGKIGELDLKVKEVALQDKYAKLLATIPGVSHYSALLISSEIADVNRFADHEHLCSYAGLVPGLRQSADKSHSTPNRTRSVMLNWIMVQCTRVHVRWCDSAITKFYKELAKRRGEKVAIVAAARKLMRAMYIMLKEEQTFRLDG